MTRHQERGFVPLILSLLAGPLIWFFNFNLAYGATGFGSAFGMSPSAILMFVWSSTVISAALLAAMMWRARRRRASNALHDITNALTGLAFCAIAFQALALWLVKI